METIEDKGEKHTVEVVEGPVEIDETHKNGHKIFQENLEKGKKLKEEKNEHHKEKGHESHEPEKHKEENIENQRINYQDDPRKEYYEKKVEKKVLYSFS